MGKSSESSDHCPGELVGIVGQKKWKVEDILEEDGDVLFPTAPPAPLIAQEQMEAHRATIDWMKQANKDARTGGLIRAIR